MTRQNITDKIWRDPDGSGYFMLDVTGQIPPQAAATINGVGLLSKDEYHVSLVPVSKISEGEVMNKLDTMLVDYFQKNPDWVRFEGITNERYLCRKDDEATVIAPARVIGLEALRSVVRQFVPDYLPAFPHVTLLKSRATERGISVNSAEDLDRYCKRLES
jgi:hypothetical protein